LSKVTYTVTLLEPENLVLSMCAITEVSSFGLIWFLATEALTHPQETLTPEM
jgi:hypothetical protein